MATFYCVQGPLVLSYCMCILLDCAEPGMEQTMKNKGGMEATLMRPLGCCHRLHRTLALHARQCERRMGKQCSAEADP